MNKSESYLNASENLSLILWITLQREIELNGNIMNGTLFSLVLALTTSSAYCGEVRFKCESG